MDEAKAKHTQVILGIAVWDLGTLIFGMLCCVGLYKRPVISD